MNKDFFQQACRLLSCAGIVWLPAKTHITPLTPDGSERRFCRLEHENGTTAVAAAPPPDDAAGLQEAVSGWHIGRHLFSSGIPVPELYGFDQQSGLLVCEDLGDTRLHDLVQKKGTGAEQVCRFYRQTMTELARMQVRAGKDFDPLWCLSTPRYDRALMLERESGYFLQALCRDFLHLEIDTKIEQDFYRLADRASQAEAAFFLHRDFQSRNIMIHQGQVRFIDYQAGRLGPLAYDPASLLLDPYAALPAQMQDELLEHYLDVLTTLLPYDRDRFREEYLLLALQRNLQILGAYAFLSQQKGKLFFSRYISPALHSLQALLAKTATAEYPYLKSLSCRCREKIDADRPDLTRKKTSD